MEKVLSGMGRLKLNPYAEEFVPAALLKAISTAVNTDSSKLDNTKQEIQSRVLSRTDSDNEQQQDWKVQLPDDIIPDFSIELEENDERLAWLHDHAEESGGLASNMLHLETCEVFDPLEVLTRQFPHVATQSLADILVTNGGNCLLAFDMLTQLELQDDFTSETRLHSQLNFEPAMQNINFGEFSDHLSGPLQSKDTDIQSQRDVVVEGLFTGRSYDSGERHRSTNFTDFASTIDENLSSITSFQGEQELIGQLEPFSGLGGYPAQTGDSLGADILNRVCQSSPVWLEADEIPTMTQSFGGRHMIMSEHAMHLNRQHKPALLGTGLQPGTFAKGQMQESLIKNVHMTAGEVISQQRNISTASFANEQSRFISYSPSQARTSCFSCNNKAQSPLSSGAHLCWY
ncbi:hypothetical protein KP509_11G080300 [Ceratopteris richardii]|uniref:CUE domain-containing protein n=2 Tax=Ceratopteris richardii TaxID=49495 RepID=A0A8T2TR15_CERRI|nr:hypothetical protein KP509_11G080300 [Ceratopteris richardii]KAH7425985.1 hypothetical protein KP509_11G080300 [Ceratopteris richardii]